MLPGGRACIAGVVVQDLGARERTPPLCAGEGGPLLAPISACRRVGGGRRRRGRLRGEALDVPRCG
eukprot:11203229-Lingulodinium_polyedra.AAC.1